MATKKTTEATVETKDELTVEPANSNESEVIAEEPVTTDSEIIAEASYTKKQIVESKQYRSYVDVLNTILGERKYTLSEVDILLNEFLCKEVD